jgi:hypothetical protein
MRELRWNLLKSERLKKTRGASFEELIQSKLIAVKRHPSKRQQRIMLFEHKGYMWVVPYVTSGNEIFLKTLYPSRKYTKHYKRGELR